MTTPSPDPRAELATLAHALRAACRRRRRAGRRRVAAARPVAGGPVGVAEPAAVAVPAATAPPTGAPAGTEPPRPPEVSPRRRGSGPNVEVAAAAPDLAALRAAVAACTACGLSATRTQTVFADGTGRARVMFVGEAPGYHEDREGVPFVGAAGQLLTDIIEKGMRLSRSDVFIANVLKCRPPENRDPTAEEKALCTPFLDRQIELLDPLVIIPLGRHAACHVLGTDTSMGRLRGRVHRVGGRAVVPTYHPAYLLRNPSAKRDCWKDIQLAMAELGLAVEGA